MAQCCTCLPRTLTFIIGFISMAGSIGGLVYLLIYMPRRQESLSDGFSGYIMAVSVNFLLAALLTIGAAKNRRGWTVPWLTFQIGGFIFLTWLLIGTLELDRRGFIALAAYSVVWLIVLMYSLQELCLRPDDKSKEAAIV